MNDKVEAIKIFDLMMKTGEEDVELTAEPTEGFEMLFPDKDMMGTILMANVKGFMEELLHFISSRIKIVCNEDKAMEAASDVPEINMTLCLDRESNCFIDTIGLCEAFENFKSRFDENTQHGLDIFWEFVMYEINDFEEELSHDINEFWKMKEKGFDIQVVKVE